MSSGVHPDRRRRACRQGSHGGVQPCACLLPPAWTGREEGNPTADNCTGQNKNTTMLWYLTWRVITDLHDRIELNFMVPGHTKFRPDSYFVLSRSTTDN